MNISNILPPTQPLSINVGGRLMSLSEPVVMGILNATPDSFFAGSRKQTEEDIAARADEIVLQGGKIIDVGACSTRPGSTPASEEEEMSRLSTALTIVRRRQPDAVVSVDTFRPAVARMAVEEFGAAIINDVSEGEDEAMLRTVSRLKVAYVLMSVRPTVEQTMAAFAEKTHRLQAIGQKDIILDPGFGFGKTLEQNYDHLARLEELAAFEMPVLVGVSRKSMIFRLLQSSPEESLGGTNVINTIALLKGAHILRVHDVKDAANCIEIVKKTLRPCSSTSL